MLLCSEYNCKNPVNYIRYTQFAGNHPFCDKHAKKEKDFLDNDNCVHWSQVPDKYYRYQIAVGGYITEYLKTKSEIQYKYLNEVGTCSEWGLYDTSRNKYVKNNWINLGLDPKLIDEISKHRMAINSLLSQIRETRQ